MSHNGNTSLMEALYEDAYEEAYAKVMEDVEASGWIEGDYPLSKEEWSEIEQKTEDLAEKMAREKFEDSEFVILER